MADNPKETTRDPRDLLEEADALIRVARAALQKMGLDRRGDDLSLSHEVRMFAQQFSPDGPRSNGEIFAKGTGRAQAFLKCNKELLASHRVAVAGQDMEAGQVVTISADGRAYSVDSDLDKPPTGDRAEIERCIRRRRQGWEDR